MKFTLMEEQEKPNTRKRTSGKIKDKERTMTKMIQAVGKVILKKGYAGLNATAIAKEAGVDKSLVWAYFGSLDNLVETYILQRDFLNSIAKGSINYILTEDDGVSPKAISALLHDQFNTLMDDKILQKIIHWEIGENKVFLRNLADKREEIGEAFFKIAEPKFKNATVDLRGTLALMIAGIYYLALHGKANGSLFCGIDVNEPEGKARIDKVITALIDQLFKEVK